MHVTLMHNPVAGDGRSGRSEIMDALRRAGYRVTYQSTKEAGFDAILEDPGDFVVAAGGDGTIEKIARRMVGRAIPLAVLPLGTANNVALSLHVGGALEDIIAGWDPPRTRSLDVGFIRTPWDEGHFVESAGLGLLAEVIVRADSVRHSVETSDADEELVANFRLIGRVVEELPSRPFRIRTEDADLAGDYLLVEMANTPYVGPRLRLGSEIDPGDGLLDLVLAPTDRRAALVQYFLEYDPQSDRMPPVDILRGRRFEVRCEAARLHVDDEIWPEEDENPEKPASGGSGSAIEAFVEPGALLIVASV